jgi:hypothetical protein
MAGKIDFGTKIEQGFVKTRQITNKTMRVSSKAPNCRKPVFAIFCEQYWLQ